MIQLDPELVLKSPWLWDEKTIEWAREQTEQRRKGDEDDREETP